MQFLVAARQALCPMSRHSRLDCFVACRLSGEVTSSFVIALIPLLGHFSDYLSAL